MFTTKELNDWANLYKEKIATTVNSKDLKDDFFRMMDLKLKERKPLWTNITKNESYKKELPKLINPYYIGYGNPDPDTTPKVLFLGKEMGFKPIKDTELTLLESINNISQWSYIVDGRDSELDFDPEIPQSYHKKEGKHSAHTWAKYTVLLSKLLNHSDLSYPNSFLVTDKKKIEESFFSKCFLTELNYIPSKKGKRKKDVRSNDNFITREEFLRENIISRFDLIIIGAWSYFSVNNIAILQKEIEGLFSKVRERKDIDYRDRKTFPFFHFETLDGTKQIYLTYQFSGFASWSNTNLSAFAERINAYL